MYARLDFIDPVTSKVEQLTLSGSRAVKWWFNRVAHDWQYLSGSITFSAVGVCGSRSDLDIIRVSEHHIQVHTHFFFSTNKPCRNDLSSLSKVCFTQHGWLLKAQTLSCLFTQFDLVYDAICAKVGPEFAILKIYVCYSVDWDCARKHRLIHIDLRNCIYDDCCLENIWSICCLWKHLDAALSFLK